jgi:FdhD protein
VETLPGGCPHNAFDKLIGRLHRERTDAEAGIVLPTSRVSVETVQKAAVAGAPILVAMSAPQHLPCRLRRALASRCDRSR